MFRSRGVLLLIPFLTYVISYVYLAVYHGEINILNTVIHEGGTYTFIETLLYAAHFIGHIPVHTVLALYFVGICLCFDSTKIIVGRSKIIVLITAVVGLVALGFLISFSWFGTEETMSFLLQKKQSVVRYEEGGSWNLHLPSTIMQFLLIPVYIYFAKWIFKSPIKLSFKGKYLIITSFLLCIFMTWLVNINPLDSLVAVWKDPRYLAHSVRELATFPLTYYPVALYVILRDSGKANFNHTENSRVLLAAIFSSGLIFILLFFYQSIIPLMAGIGELAQKPDFAKGGELSILYLLSSHFFEHFLESVYFILLSMLLFFLVKKYQTQNQIEYKRKT